MGEAAAWLPNVANVPIPIMAMVYHGFSHCGREAGEFLRCDEIAQYNVAIFAKLLADERR